MFTIKDFMVTLQKKDIPGGFSLNAKELKFPELKHWFAFKDAPQKGKIDDLVARFVEIHICVKNELKSLYS